MNNFTIVWHQKSAIILQVLEEYKLAIDWFVIQKMPRTVIRFVMIKQFIQSILKSLVIITTWLGLSSAIYSEIALFFALNHIFY